MFESRSQLLYKNLSRFIFVTILLVTIGFVFIYSSSSVFALEKFGRPHFYLFKHLLGLTIGLAGLLFFRYFPLRIIKKLAPYIFLGSVFITALTLVPGIGIKINGSQRWISLGVTNLQPSELLKIGIILYFAFIITNKKYSLSSFFYSYLPFLTILGITAVTLLRQPDFGQAVTICLMAFLLLFIAKVKFKHLILTVIPLLPILSFLIYIKPYRLKRILIFLNPWKYSTGAGFQIIQSLIAIGSGGLTGLGLSNSKQKFFYLPMQHTDFIFSIIAEETGFLGIFTIIFLYVLFLYYGLKIACNLQKQFFSYLVLGFVLLTSIQALINMSVTIGLLPTKGLGLPFVSYSNSSLVANLSMIGLVINCVYSDAEEPAFSK